MGVYFNIGFENFRLILRLPEGRTTSGGSDDGHLTEAVIKDNHGLVLGRRVFRDAHELVEQLCPRAVPERPPAEPPGGTPPDLRERIARALSTVDAAFLDAAVRGYRGIYLSAAEYIETRLAEHLPPFLQWLLACCDPDKLRAGYELDQRAVWAIPYRDTRVLVFETDRDRRLPPDALVPHLRRGAARTAAVDFLIHGGLAADLDPTRSGDIIAARAAAFFAAEPVPPTTNPDAAVDTWGKSYLAAMLGLQGTAS
ncbi:MAG TPA: hypothetical protein VIK91_01150 [Nannocystis sp.]